MGNRELVGTMTVKEMLTLLLRMPADWGVLLEYEEGIHILDDGGRQRAASVSGDLPSRQVVIHGELDTGD